MQQQNNTIKKDEDIEGYLVLSLAKTALWLSKCAEYYKNKKFNKLMI